MLISVFWLISFKSLLFQRVLCTWDLQLQVPLRKQQLIQSNLTNYHYVHYQLVRTSSRFTLKMKHTAEIPDKQNFFYDETVHYQPVKKQNLANVQHNYVGNGCLQCSLQCFIPNEAVEKSKILNRSPVCDNVLLYVFLTYCQCIYQPHVVNRRANPSLTLSLGIQKCRTDLQRKTLAFL